MGLAAVVLCGLAPSNTLGQAQHPLDGLTASEHWSVFETLKASGHVDSSARYSGITLREPPKAEVLAWKQGQPFRREALVIVRQGKQTFEAVVDVRGQKVISWRELKGIQPSLTEEELTGVEETVKENPEWKEAMKRRGITDFETVKCVGLTPGNFGTPEEEGRRLQRVVCWDRRGTWNADARPITGLVAVWDADEKKVLRVIDTGVVPVSRAEADYDLDSVGKLREVSSPIALDQPLGPGFRVNGHEVDWQKWQFHFRVDSRVGLVVSNVRYVDGEKARSILYQGMLSEIFVPYMDPSEGWYHWTFMDAGEYYNAGNGGLPTSLEAGTDCPANSVYFDAVFANHFGIPVKRPRAACLFESYAGDFAWRHMSGPDQIESRPQRNLILRMMATVGNYDYCFDWVFQQNGTIKVIAAATGIDNVKGVRSRTVAEDRDGKDGAYGRFIAENIVAPNHDHFFSFRLDLDVDGTANSLVRDKLKMQRLPADHPRKSLWVIEEETAKTEQQAQAHMMMEKPELWRVINPSVIGPLGYPVSYQIQAGHNAVTLLTPDDPPRRRAGFIDHHLWVTPQKDNERFAAGDFPTQSKGGDGLPAWTSANRPIENTDIVVWYTMGFHHVPRSEDWPVMPTARHEFELRPFDFFARNPALDLPKRP
jgi:primary-amine oxidase